MKLIKTILFLFLFSLLFIYTKKLFVNAQIANITPPLIKEQENTIIFDDEFKGNKINTQIWNMYPNGGSITISGGKVTLAGGINPGRFPFLETKIAPVPPDSQKPQDDIFTIETRINLHGPNDNIGFIMGPYQDPNQPVNIYDSGFTYNGGVWAYGGINDVYNTKKLTSTPLSPGYHTYRYSFHGTDWFFYIDGVQVAAQHDNSRPAYLYFGNPNPTGTFTNTTSMQVDYIKIFKPLNP